MQLLDIKNNLKKRDQQIIKSVSVHTRGVYIMDIVINTEFVSTCILR